MEHYSLEETTHHLEKLIADAYEGKTVLIAGEKEGIVVQLVPVSNQPKPRKAGSARGKIHMADDFDAPLTDFDECILMN